MGKRAAYTQREIVLTQLSRYNGCNGERFSTGCSDRSRRGQADILAAVQGAPQSKQGLSSLQQSDGLAAEGRHHRPVPVALSQLILQKECLFAIWDIL